MLQYPPPGQDPELHKLLPQWLSQTDHSEWGPPGALSLLQPRSLNENSPSQSIVQPPVDATLVQDEYLTSHLQYIADNFASGLTALATEIHLLDCQQRKHIALVLELLSKQSSVRAAMHLKLPKCQSVNSLDKVAIVYQCKILNVAVSAQLTSCGFEPSVKNKTIGLYGYTLYSFIPCLRRDGFAVINDKPYRWDNDSVSWIEIPETIELSRTHLASTFQMTPDASGQEGLQLVEIHDNGTCSLLR